MKLFLTGLLLVLTVSCGQSPALSIPLPADGRHVRVYVHAQGGSGRELSGSLLSCEESWISLKIIGDAIVYPVVAKFRRY